MTVPDPAFWTGLAQTASEAELDAGPTIEARFDGTCQGCGGRWDAGDLITYDHDEGAWMHASCEV